MGKKNKDKAMKTERNTSATKKAHLRSLAAHLSAIQQCFSVARVLLVKKHKRERNRKDNTQPPCQSFGAQGGKRAYVRSRRAFAGG